MARSGFTAAKGKKRTSEVLDAIDRAYPEARVALDHDGPLQLLVATILSAQCTDERVNRVTPELFRRHPDAAALAAADPAELERLIHSTGFFRNKAKAIRAASQQLVERHGGEVPTSIEALTALSGVARKTANVLLSSGFGAVAGIVVDTHVKRLAGRLGLSAQSDPVKIERDLMALVPRERWARFGFQLIEHGRRVCHARKPQCEGCVLTSHCPARASASSY